MDLRSFVRDVPDFPKPGILFKDITPVLRDPHAFGYAIDRLTEPFWGKGIDVVVGIEARGFLFGVPIAQRLGVGFVPVRKKGKLPYKKRAATYALEYGFDTVEMHEDALKEGHHALVVDDLLATGGTAKAAIELVRGLGGKVTSCAFLIELSFLEGREKLAPTEVVSLVKYEAE